MLTTFHNLNEQLKVMKLEIEKLKLNQKPREIKNGVFWVVTPCGSGKNRRFGGTWRLLHQGDKNR
jgi:hypothetical protein